MAMTFAFSDQCWAAAKKKKTEKGVSSIEERSTSKKKTPLPPEEINLDQVWQQYETGDEKERKDAISELRKHLKKNPEDGVGHYYLGMIFSREGSLAKAEEHLRNALQLIPDSPDVMYQLADVLAQMNGEEVRAESDELLKKVLAINPTHPGALARKGLQEAESVGGDGAIESLTKARDADPQNRLLLLALGRALLEKGRASEAFEPLKIASQLDVADIEAHQLLGRCYQALNRPKEAAEEFALAKGRGKTAAEGKELVGYDLARNLAASGKSQDAIAEYHRMIKISSDQASGWSELGQLFHDLKERENAVKAYKKWYELAGASEAAYRVAQIEREIGDLEKVRDALSMIAKKKDEWGERAKTELEEVESEIRERERDALVDQAGSGDEKSREQAFHRILEMDKKDRYALEGLRDLSITRGDLENAKFYTKELKKAGYISKSDAKKDIEKLEVKQDAGDDIAAWESRFKDCKKSDDWDGAINELLKLKEYSKGQLESMKGSSSPGKTTVTTTIRSRIQDYNRELKELRAKKRSSRKKK